MRGVTALLMAMCLSIVQPTALRADENDFQAWVQGVGHIALDSDKKTQLYLEAQPRLGDDWKRFERLLLRPGLAYNVRQDLAVYLGYAWTPGFLDFDLHRRFTDEHRIWQQLLFRHEMGRMQWQHRLRPEQRFIEGVDGVSHRMRYALRGAYPLSDDGSWGMFGSNELFVNLNAIDPGPEVGYDRNRVILGPFWQVGRLRYELGYVVEHVAHFGGEQRLVQAFLMLVSFDL